jgi:hypothetical protein
VEVLVELLPQLSREFRRKLGSPAARGLRESLDPGVPVRKARQGGLPPASGLALGGRLPSSPEHRPMVRSHLQSQSGGIESTAKTSGKRLIDV